jgi:hypothetical protein
MLLAIFYCDGIFGCYKGKTLLKKPESSIFRSSICAKRSLSADRQDDKYRVTHQKNIKF